MTENAFPLVSVVVPCFNAAPTLMRTIRSIRGQNYSNIEIIIVDDASTDAATIEILLDLKVTDIHLVHHDVNLGLSAARNTGFANSNGDYVVFLDSDDWLEPSTVSKMVGAIPKVSNKFFIYCDLSYEGDRIGTSQREYRPFSQLAINKIPYCILIPRLEFEFGKPYCEELREGLEDWDLNLTLLEHHYLPVRVGEPLFHYSVSRHGMFASVTKRKYFTIWGLIRKRHKNLYGYKSLLGRAKLEIRKYGYRSTFFATLLLIVSQFPIDSALNKLFRVHGGKFRHSSL
jgi:glycosyltransferase involved in cell wall biosynthesis